MLKNNIDFTKYIEKGQREAGIKILKKLLTTLKYEINDYEGTATLWRFSEILTIPFQVVCLERDINSYELFVKLISDANYICCVSKPLYLPF